MMLFGAYKHIVNPEFYAAFIPDFLPKFEVNYLSGIIEGIIGILIIIPHFRKIGLQAFIGLMIAFFPIHIWDLFKEVPAIGSKQAAIIRLSVQVIFIMIGVFLLKQSKKKEL